MSSYSESRSSVSPELAPLSNAAVCKMCTIQLERLCYQRSLWFRLFRNALAAAVRIWSLGHPVDPSLYRTRSQECHGCIRFRKNVLKEKSSLFRCLDGYVNPLFNRARDCLLTPEEMERARAHAAKAVTRLLLAPLLVFGLPLVATGPAWAEGDGPVEFSESAGSRTSATASVAPSVAAAASAPTATPAPTSTTDIEVLVVSQRPGSAEDGFRSRKAVLGPFGELSLREVPFSINVTPSALWESRSAHTEQEVLRTNPTVTDLMSPLAPGGGGMSRTMVRGGTMGDQGVMRDGLVDRGFTYPWFENVERVEVMNGLSSLFNGFGTLGGTVNYVSKRPRPTPYGVVSLGNYGGGINYGTGDFSGPVPGVNSRRFLFRTVVHQEYGNTFVEQSVARRTLLSTALTYRPFAGAEFGADVAFQRFYAQGLQNYMDVNPSKGIHVPSPSIIDPRKQYGQQWTFSASNKLLVGPKLTVPLSKLITLRAAYRYGTMWRRYNTTFGSFIDNSGNYNETFVATPRQAERTNSAYVTADIRFATGPVEHQITTGYNGTEFYYERGNDLKVDLGVSNVSAPLVVPFAPAWVSGSANASRTYYDSLILGERAVWKWISAIGGVNYAQIRAKSWVLSSSCTTSGQCPASGVNDSTQGAFTPSLGLVLHPIQELAVYGSYIEGLSQGGTAPVGAQNAYEVLPTKHGNQLELGAKGDLFELQWTLAFFRLNQANEFLDPSDNYYKQDGRQVNQGVEFTAVGPIAGGVSVIGGFTLLRAETTGARNNPALEGKAPVNVPGGSGRLVIEYALPPVPGLVLDLGGNYNGKRYVDALNTESFQSSVTLDAGARYEKSFAKHTLGLSLFIANLGDQRYWAYYRSGSGLLPGAPRSISVSAKLGFR